jgi:hypothetical protein
MGRLETKRVESSFSMEENVAKMTEIYEELV